MTHITNKEFGGERPLYGQHNLYLENVTIHVGESSLKETSDIACRNCRFEGKYVFWECRRFDVADCTFTEGARSSLWYSERVKMTRCKVDAPKLFRRMRGIVVTDTTFSNAIETFWDCSDITLRNCRILQADYLFMHCHDIDIADYYQEGNYSFQYARRVIIQNAVLHSKDSFWESEDCTLIDCELDGEYLAWYARNLRLVRCHIKGGQPLCYCENLILEDCTFDADAWHAFEYSSIKATIRGDVTSIKNPTTGCIEVSGRVGEIIIDDHQKAPADCIIVTEKA